jgi:hypothetical protein
MAYRETLPRRGISMTGIWRASWENEKGKVEHVGLKPLDVISFPPGASRRFMNVKKGPGGKRGVLMFVIGGAGKWRGGMSDESCFIPHRTPAITQDTLSSGNAIPTSPGMMGDRPVFRQFHCPGCGALIENEIAREGDELLRDIELQQ